MRSFDQVGRLLKLVPYLSGHPGITIQETATAFGVAPATILKDLQVLQFCGLPGGLPDDLFEVDIDAAREDGEIWVGNTEVLARPMTLRADEATTLLVALRALDELGSKAAATAAAKLSSALGKGPEAIEVTVTSGDARVRANLVTAIEERRVVIITHRGREGIGSVAVEPARLRVSDGATYLDAWSRPRAAWRSFRLDRITACEPTNECCGEHSGLDQATGQWFADATTQLTLQVTEAAAWLRDHYPISGVESVGDELRITLPIGSRDWAIALLLRLGSAVTFVADIQIADAAAAEARAALAHYTQPGTSS